MHRVRQRKDKLSGGGRPGGFGRWKIEQVQEQRAKGKTIKIIREADLLAALEGRRAAPPKPAAPKPPAPKPAPKPVSKPAPAPSAQKTSDEAAARAERIQAVLSDTPMTAPEINAALGTDYTVLQIVNAVKPLPVGMVKALRIETTARGEVTLKEFSAYYPA